MTDPFSGITASFGDEPESSTSGIPSPIVLRRQMPLTKGRITVLSSTGEEMATREFIANPNEISDNKSIEWGSAKVAGASHPVYQFGCGGERLITFELYIDGVRNAILRNEGVDISDVLRWYRSLLYPRKYRLESFDVFPPIVLFSFGNMWKSVECLVKKADIKVTYYSPDLRPIRAKISMALAEVVKKSQRMEDVGFTREMSAD